MFGKFGSKNESLELTKAREELELNDQEHAAWVKDFLRRSEKKPQDLDANNPQEKIFLDEWDKHDAEYHDKLDKLEKEVEKLERVEFK